jgi:hypothetical protein
VDAARDGKRRWSVSVWLVPLLCLLIVAAGVGGFFGGKAVAEGDGTADRTTSGDGRPTDGSAPTGMSLPSDGSGRTGGGLVSGSIVSADESSITIQLEDGNTQIVYFADSTTISETKDATSDVLTDGEDVTVVGSANEDGSLTATSIQVGAAMSGVFGGGGMPGSGEMPAGGEGGVPSGASGDTDAGSTATTE